MDESFEDLVLPNIGSDVDCEVGSSGESMPILLLWEQDWFVANEELRDSRVMGEGGKSIIGEFNVV